ncbi:MAG: hypothetical protein JWM93_3210 [Frankiales bacterium]|nr:hypothetical protein [Frankiales bacterium]
MHRVRGMTFALSALALVAVVTPPAFAATPVSRDRHCVGSAGQPGRPTPAAPLCFATYAESVAYLTGGDITLTPDAQFAPTDSALLAQINGAAVSITSTFVLSIEYTNSAFGGSTFTFTGPTDCAAGDYFVGSMPSGWNDVISSSQPFSSCWALHYENAGATVSGGPTGDSINCYNTTVCTSMGTMNDRTSSMRWV